MTFCWLLSDTDGDLISAAFTQDGDKGRTNKQICDADCNKNRSYIIKKILYANYVNALFHPLVLICFTEN